MDRQTGMCHTRPFTCRISSATAFGNRVLRIKASVIDATSHGADVQGIGTTTENHVTEHEMGQAMPKLLPGLAAVAAPKHADVSGCIERFPALRIDYQGGHQRGGKRGGGGARISRLPGNPGSGRMKYAQIFGRDT